MGSQTCTYRCWSETYLFCKIAWKMQVNIGSTYLCRNEWNKEHVIRTLYKLLHGISLMILLNSFLSRHSITFGSTKHVTMLFFLSYNLHTYDIRIFCYKLHLHMKKLFSSGLPFRLVWIYMWHRYNLQKSSKLKLFHCW